MALVIFPTTDYDAFVTVVNCDSLLEVNVIGTQRAAYDALSDGDKEIYIRQATTLIKHNAELPTTLEDDLQLATAYLVNHSVGIDMLNSDNTSNVKVKDIDGVVKTEYFSQNSDSNSFPDIVQSLLEQYDGAVDGSFTFSRA